MVIRNAIAFYLYLMKQEMRGSSLVTYSVLGRCKDF